MLVVVTGDCDDDEEEKNTEFSPQLHLSCKKIALHAMSLPVDSFSSENSPKQYLEFAQSMNLHS